MNTDFTLQKRIERQQQKRHQEAQACLEIAESCLDKLIKCNFSVPDLAVHAYRYLLKGLKLNRSNPRFYYQLAFLLALYRRRDLAAHYLKQALTLDPAYKEALHLQSRLQQVTAEPLINTEVDFTEPELSLLTPQSQRPLLLNFQRTPILTADEAEQIYADLLHTLPELLRQIQAEAEDWKLSLIPTVIAQDRIKLEQVQTQLTELEAQILQIRPFQSVSELQQILRDLQVLGERLYAYSQCSQLALSLRDQITELIKEARQVRQTQQENSPQAAAEFELLLDGLFARYELIADQIERLELESLDITALERYFSPLSRLLENLQNA